MLEKFYDGAFRIYQLRRAPCGKLLDGFAQELAQEGYARMVGRMYIRAAAHFMYWATKQRVAPALGTQNIDRFLVHLKKCRCPSYGRTDQTRGAWRFLKYLQSNGAATTSVATATDQDPPVLTAFQEWMRQRGVCNATLHSYCMYIRELLDSLGTDPERFNAATLRKFVLDNGRRTGRGLSATKTCTHALRMFIRSLIASGLCPVGLDKSIPTVVYRRLSSLPRYLQPAQIERVIAACGHLTPIDLRDRAIVVLLARLALRGDDIVQLRLTDIDWSGAWINVSGKGRRHTQLPLTQEVGKAISSYLLNGRPPTNCDAVFIRARAPFRALSDSGAVSLLVKKVMRRAGVVCSSRGAAHILRHSAATSMLRQGASLQDIAAVLRHRSIDTTQIYAKVDFSALRDICQPWPKVR